MGIDVVILSNKIELFILKHKKHIYFAHGQNVIIP